MGEFVGLVDSYVDVTPDYISLEYWKIDGFRQAFSSSDVEAIIFRWIESTVLLIILLVYFEIFISESKSFTAQAINIKVYQL